ncbi:MAG: adenylyl-sulfate kinase [Erysipelotrichaceae bacterium]|nr:adenylyl-sulfate kinase [Erysipelotrichaceae bacterium]
MLKEKLSEIDLLNWSAPAVREDMPHGDMPGDKIVIGAEHERKAQKIFPVMIKMMRELGKEKVIVSVFGGSGVGKSEIASLLAYYLTKSGIRAYVMSGDNYPYRIPLYNDAERAAIFRSNALKGLVEAGEYSKEVREELSVLWEKEVDPDPKLKEAYPWLNVYQTAGRKALAQYLGTMKEQDYDQVNQIFKEFKEGKKKIFLKRMGRSEDVRYYDEVDFSDIDVLIIEWTHGGNENLKGIDIPILLNSTPEETREHRRLRARDGKTDSAFTTMVLEIEQMELDARAVYASIILSKAGELIRPAE